MGQENRDKVLSLVTETQPSQPNKSVRRIVSIQGIVIYVQPTHTIRRVVQTLTRSEPIWLLGNLSLRAPRIVDRKAELQMRL
ncbi:hypothetical protein CDR19_15055 [Ectopseudomonas toyotomiensis]|uniref:Uncharacterized protein n=1 Tax=Ectopseudomonas toyotomiensis TaxID=554344 RepID=A0A1I5SFV9_9GAMM|nr:hypothetical protein CDR19_15055 [Pseudomonas toyotomiensis]SDA79572.1 hypothetical protein SAMN03159475_4295 [Pseudomonas sp. NFPP33]SFP69595.1 hypothetical protein SAMN05216177_104235 [Pseudomonas toyotomiensis]